MYISSETYNRLVDARGFLAGFKKELQEEISHKKDVLAMVEAELFAVEAALANATYEPFADDSPCVPPIGGDL